MFIDIAKIYVKAGNGGKGCQSHYRDKFMRPPKNIRFWRGRPDGGNGGNGGNVIIQASSHLWSLLDFRYNQHFNAENGKHGGSNNKRGKDGQDKIIKVPVGTIVRDFRKQYLLGDLDEDNKSLTVAKGGKGGLGNVHIDQATEGEKAEEIVLEFELKLISDFSIIGFPNVGKSSLIRCITNSESKVANYPFTTKSPILGVVDFEGRKIVVADMPGLIKDAHQGKGLGLHFLRHIKRTRVLIHVIDMSGSEGRDPLEDYKTINRELKFYDKELAKRAQLIVANKMDIDSAKENLKRFRAKVRRKIIPVSALHNEGIEKVLEEIRDLGKVVNIST